MWLGAFLCTMCKCDDTKSQAQDEINWDETIFFFLPFKGLFFIQFVVLFLGMMHQSPYLKTGRMKVSTVYSAKRLMDHSACWFMWFLMLLLSVSFTQAPCLSSTLSWVCHLFSPLIYFYYFLFFFIILFFVISSIRVSNPEVNSKRFKCVPKVLFWWGRIQTKWMWALALQWSAWVFLNW